MSTLTETQTKSVSNKLSDLEIERFSISSFNGFRRNRFTWYLRYVLGFKSRWPMVGAWRGQAIESAVMRGMTVKEETIESLVAYGILTFQRKVAEKLISVYPKVIEGYDAEKIGQLLQGMTKEKFPDAIRTIIESHFRLNEGEDLVEYLTPESKDYSKYLKQIEKQYAIIEEAIPEAVKWYKEQSSKFDYQKRITYSGWDLGIPVLGFTDIEFVDFGTDLKSGQKMPKTWNDVALDYKLQASFYSLATGKPWKIIYVSKLSNDQVKENIIAELNSKGYSSKEIATKFKDYSPDGKGTTEPTVLKTLEIINSEGWEPHIPIRVFDLPPEEVDYYNRINRFTGESILNVIKSCRRDHLEEDMRFHCLGDLEHMFIDKDEKKKIKDVWGFELVEEEAA